MFYFVIKSNCFKGGNMKKDNYLLYDVFETPPKGKMVILALQHVLAMFGATILVPILVNNLTGSEVLTIPVALFTCRWAF